MVKTSTKIFESIRLLFNGFNDPQEGLYMRGKLYVEEDGKKASFFEYLPKRGPRNHRIYRDDRTLLMRTPDGRYKLYLTFLWEGNRTWMVLTTLLHEVYAQLKNSVCR